MKEKVRQERSQKLQNIIDATVCHLERAQSALEDANLYTNEEQEHQVDILTDRLENLIKDMRFYLP